MLLATSYRLSVFVEDIARNGGVQRAASACRWVRPTCSLQDTCLHFVGAWLPTVTSTVCSASCSMTAQHKASVAQVWGMSQVAWLLVLSATMSYPAPGRAPHLPCLPCGRQQLGLDNLALQWMLDWCLAPYLRLGHASRQLTDMWAVLCCVVCRVASNSASSRSC